MTADFAPKQPVKKPSKFNVGHFLRIGLLSFVINTIPHILIVALYFSLYGILIGFILEVILIVITAIILVILVITKKFNFINLISYAIGAIVNFYSIVFVFYLLISGSGVVHLAAATGQPFVLEALARQNSDINSPNRWGETPLDIATSQGHEKTVETLLRLGAKIDNEAILIAARVGRIDILKRFQEAGANFNDPEFYDSRLLCAAVDSGNIEVVQFVMQTGRGIKYDDALARAVSHNQTEIAALLIKAGADVNKLDENKQSYLFNALGNLNIEIEMVDLLLNSGADMDYASSDGMTPVMEAIDQGDVKMMQLFINKGFNVNKRFPNGETPLQYATGKEQPEIVALLKQAGAKH